MNNTYQLITSFLSSPFVMMIMAIFIFLIIGFFVLVAVIIKLSTQLRYITYPVYDHVVKEAQSKANEILTEAEVKSRSIIATAHQSADKLISDRGDENKKFQDDYIKQFEEIVTNGKDTLSNQSVELMDLSKNMSDEFKKHLLTTEVLIHKESDMISETLSEEVAQLKQSFDDMNTKASQGHDVFIEETKKHVSEEINKEILMARDAISAYRKERFNLLDKEVVGLVEETARIALNRTFSLREHRDQVLSALKEAKSEGIFNE